MLEVSSALQLVLEHAVCKPPERVPLAQALGLVLAENVTSDVDSPPHDKSVVDGYAVQAADLEGGSAELRVLEEVTAGQTPLRNLVRGATTRIMTGAPIPSGTDAVVMVEETSPTKFADGSDGVRIAPARFRVGQNIMRQGVSLRRGQEVLSAGRIIRPIEVGLLAEVGRAEVKVYARPHVAVLATGNELVPASQVPAAGQIRNSNGPMLAALIAKAGGLPLELGIARDNQADLSAQVARGLESDVLVLSGGVSAGVLDLVPGILGKHGVRQVFHKVNLKPGKPIWFGVLPPNGGDKLVFGLPGNPASTLVCFELFVRPALARLAGRGPVGLVPIQARLSAPFEQRGDRPTYYPARTLPAQSAGTPADIPSLELLDWRGSADLRTLTDADSLAYFPVGESKYQAGDLVTAYWL